MTFEPTQHQSDALDAIERWRHDAGRQIFTLGGYAGTGKTALAKHYLEQQDGEPLALAPTGKATSRLQQKLSSISVCTVHHALYCPVSPSLQRLEELEKQQHDHPEDLKCAEAVREEKLRLKRAALQFSVKEESLIEPGQLVVVDEASMVTAAMLQDLIATGAKLLFIGDPGQLPPVRDFGFFQQCPPDLTLTEIHRQALGSPIIRMSQEIRHGNVPDRTEQPGFRKIPKREFPMSTAWLQFDQVITGKNATRRGINNAFRSLLGHTGPWPQTGERLICLKNEKDHEAGFINGVPGLALDDFQLTLDHYLTGGLRYEDVDIESEAFYRIPFWQHLHEDAVDEPWFRRRHLREFDYAYAITAHKSQGSEWKRVILADDAMQHRNREFRLCWLYTAVTRAEEELLWLY